MKKKNIKIILLLASKVFGGAEKNLKRNIESTGFPYLILEKNDFLQIFKTIFLNNRVVLIPLGFRNSILSRLIKILFFRKIYLISSIRATEYQKSEFRIILDRCSSFLVDKWVSNSFAGKNIYVGREKIKSNKISVIYNTPLTYTKDINPNVLGNLKTVNILLIGHIRQEKGYNKLPEIVELLAKTEIPFKITVIGAGDLKQIFKHNFYIYNKYVTHHNNVNNVSKYLNDNDILLNISDDEGVPTTFLECSVNNLPIIASNISGNREYVWSYFNGVLCDQDELNAFVEAIIEVVRNYNYYRNNAKKRFEIYNKHTKFDQILWKRIIKKGI